MTKAKGKKVITKADVQKEIEALEKEIETLEKGHCYHEASVAREELNEARVKLAAL